MRGTETWIGTARGTEIVTAREITPTCAGATALPVPVATVTTSMVAGNTEATITLEVGVEGMAAGAGTTAGTEAETWDATAGAVTLI
jgi:hypothetical protein